MTALSTARLLGDLLSQSRAVDGHAYLSSTTERWVAGLEPQLPARFWVHHDAAARQAADLLGAAGFAHGDRIFLGNHPAVLRESVLRHELVHLAQVQLGLRTGCVASPAAVEVEAHALGGLPVAAPVRHGADPNRIYPFWFLIPIGIGLTLLFWPDPANAPGPQDPILPPTPGGLKIAETLCFWVVPGGAFKLGARLGFGFLTKSALAGASTNLSWRAVDDVAQGHASSPLLYVYDVGTGAAIGFVVPGGVQLIGRGAGRLGLDALAQYGLTKTHLSVLEALGGEFAKGPLTLENAQQILQQRGLMGNISEWWLNRRNVIVLYRGQQFYTDQILGPLARLKGVGASEALLKKLQSLAYSDVDIATFSARHHSRVFGIPGFDPPELFGLAPGSVGIPASRIPGIASGFAPGPDGVIYIIRAPKGSAVQPTPWPDLAAEQEMTFFSRVPLGTIVKVIPASRVAPLRVENGLLEPGYKVAPGP